MRFMFLAENQLGGAAGNHVGRRVCAQPHNDMWHHGGRLLRASPQRRAREAVARRSRPGRVD